MNLGDFAAGDTIDFHFPTRRFSTGAPHQLAGSPAVSVYKANGTTQSTAGITLTVDFDSFTGLNHVRITTASDGTFYADGQQFSVVITAGTVDSVSVVGEVVARFTLRALACLYPTTAGRKLDVSAGGEAGVDWANVGSPTTTNNLSATSISTSQAVASVSGNVGGDVVGSVASVTAAGALTSSERNSIADALLDRADGVETSRTVREAMRLILSAEVGKLSGVSSGAPVFRDSNDTKDRITATTTADGRTTVALDDT